MRDLSGGFTPDQMRRYSRQILLPDLGGRGQARLLASTVAIPIDGAAGRVAAAYLAAAGVGTLILTGDLDRPATSSDFPLARPDLGQPLGPALLARLSILNPDAHIELSGPHEAPGDRFLGRNSAMSRRGSNDSRDLADRNLSPMLSGVSEIRTMSIDGDADELALAEAMARGGEAAARIAWRIAVGKT